MKSQKSDTSMFFLNEDGTEVVKYEMTLKDESKDIITEKLGEMLKDKTFKERYPEDNNRRAKYYCNERVSGQIREIVKEEYKSGLFKKAKYFGDIYTYESPFTIRTLGAIAPKSWNLTDNFEPIDKAYMDFCVKDIGLLAVLLNVAGYSEDWRAKHQNDERWIVEDKLEDLGEKFGSELTNFWQTSDSLGVGSEQYNNFLRENRPDVLNYRDIFQYIEFMPTDEKNINVALVKELVANKENLDSIFKSEKDLYHALVNIFVSCNCVNIASQNTSYVKKLELRPNIINKK